jgi:hypothetical protein
VTRARILSGVETLELDWETAGSEKLKIYGHYIRICRLCLESLQEVSVRRRKTASVLALLLNWVTWVRHPLKESVQRFIIVSGQETVYSYCSGSYQTRIKSSDAYGLYAHYVLIAVMQSRLMFWLALSRLVKMIRSLPIFPEPKIKATI